MDWSFAGWPDWFITTLLGVAAAVIIYLGRFRLGLTEAQVATAEEREKLLLYYEKRIEAMEDEISKAEDRIRWLEAENTQLSRRLKRLEDSNDAARVQ